MMELLEWLQLLNDLEKQLEVAKNVNNIIFVGYVIVATLAKKAAPLVAFLFCVLLVGNEQLLAVSEFNMYMLVVVIYSYTFNSCDKKQSKYACVTICLLSLSLAIDAFLYGTDGYYGTRQTILWENIEYLAACAHLVFISSFISIERIRDGLRDFVNSISRIALNSDYMLFSWYTIYKIQSTKQKT
tara:strand:- start:2593 stop:3150 length:558 start_codon:yes stop_codon:yes gene_type:complete